ncbi:MAG: pyruvate kinase [Saprospiraceae bacterium]
MYTGNLPTQQTHIDVQQLRAALLQAENQSIEAIRQVHPRNRDSARNLIHYMALRSVDLRHLQEQLSELSISSFAHAEGYILHNLLGIEKLLAALDEGPSPQEELIIQTPFTYRTSKRKLQENAVQLFGHDGKSQKRSWIMVTMPQEAAEDPSLTELLLKNGMTIARINTSHDSPQVWAKMIQHIRTAEQKTGKLCKIYFDLAGPKLRTVFEKTHILKKKRRGKKESVRLFKGDLLWLGKDRSNLPFTKETAPEELIAMIGITLPEVLQNVQQGARIYFDDGKIGGVVSTKDEFGIFVEITQAAVKGTRLRPQKGINFPDTQLKVPSLTENDFTYLPFIAEHGDIVGYSFVRTVADVHQLQSELERLKRSDMGIVLKIENKEAFDNLPALLLAAMRSSKAGVMIARGDLAVELGYERIAEVQEEILWICEAAHLPNIWATQVLESLAKKGLATRSEITDAAMAVRAECVMLNKGTYILDALRMLVNILERMEHHVDKKRGSFRPLGVAKRFLENHSRVQ